MDTVPINAGGGAANGRTVGSHDARVSKRGKNKGVKRLSIIAGIVIIVVLLGLGGWLLYGTSTGSVINSGEYQAVFFTNGQVYFGKLHSLNNNYMTLTDVYYLQAPDTNSKNPQQTSDQSNVQLVKLGNEVHGPVDQMVINKDQVLFFENLKNDGKVSSSITKFQQTQKH